MPEYKKGPFNLLPNPPYEELALHSEVYQIWPSGEIFTNYEQYADRLYHYNQREWSCKYTGKGQLTFAEAYASEEKARKALESFPEAWKGPLLAFIQHSTASLDQICNQFMEFIKVNYIPGEDIKIDFNGRRMNGKVITSIPIENDINYRVEIYEDEAFMQLVGEANVIGSGSFSRERQYLNKSMIKRYAKSVANRRGPNYPWFISDELAQIYGITIDLPPGFTLDMKPMLGGAGRSNKQNDQLSIDNYFMNSSAGFLADERSVSPPPPQFSFPCDDAIVPVELIDTELKYPELVPINQFINDSSCLTRSLSVWSFCQTFSSQLKLSPFAYDDWEEAMTCTDPSVDSNPIIEETFLALFSTLMKDRRNLTKGAFADKLKSSVLTFKCEHAEQEEEVKQEAEVKEEVEDEGPEIVISSDEESETELFVKRPRKSSSKSTDKKPKSLLLPLIDLRKHRWYESKAMEYWHFVLGSFFLELIDMIAQFAAEEQAKSEEEEEEESESEQEESGDDISTQDDSDYEDDKSDESEKKKSVESSSEDAQVAAVGPKLKQLSAVESPLEVMQNFIKIYEPIVEALTEKGSKELFSTYLNLSLSSKLALLEFLVHNHHDRETFKAFVEDCLERQADTRRNRKEVEIEAKIAQAEVEKIEEQVAGLKEENAKITERLEADESDIEMSEEEEGESEKEEKSEGDDKQGETKQGDDKQGNIAISLPPLTEKEREELMEKRAGNKKEISVLNATLRKLRPEAAALQKKSDAANRDLRKCSSFRTFPVGSDRHNRDYWWFGEFVSPLGRILVLDPAKGQWLGAIDSEAKFAGLMEWLNPLGIREAKLKANLMEIEEDVKTYLTERDLPETMTTTDTLAEVSAPSDSEEVDFDAFRRGRGRPPKGTSVQPPAKRPFQKYKNTLIGPGCQKLRNMMAEDCTAGGFDFSNYLRNEHLTSKGMVNMKTTKTGTTIVGLTYKDGIVLGADTRATEGPIVADKNCEKIHYIAPNIYCCGAGTAADTEFTTNMISSKLELHSLTSGREAKVVTAMTMLKQYLFRYQGHVGAALILGGVDHAGAHLYTIYPHGSTDRLPYVTMGSGSLNAMAVFEATYRPNMEKEEAIALVAQAIRAGIFNDLGSGSNVDVTVISATEGVQVLRNYQNPNERPQRERKYIYPSGSTAVLKETVRPINWDIVEEREERRMEE